jgi:hypothetical protein
MIVYVVAELQFLKDAQKDIHFRRNRVAQLSTLVVAVLQQLMVPDSGNRHRVPV